MLKTNTESLEGNNQFEGFAIDLIFELSLLLEFSYTFILEEDGNYGICVNNITNEWNGMMGSVISGVSSNEIGQYPFSTSKINWKNYYYLQRADIAITDLTVTSERIKALDFTPSIMNLGESHWMNSIFVWIRKHL